MTTLDTPSISGIYRITCTTTARIYVGSAVNLRKRQIEHFTALQRGDHHNIYLQRAFTKYGPEAFQFDILEIVLLPEMLTAREQDWFHKLKPFGKKGFNLVPTAGSSLGYKHTPEELEKMRTVRIGQKSSPEARAKISASLVGNTRGVGRKDTPETRARRSASHLGKKRDPEVCKRIGDAQRGRKATPEQIEKNRLGHLGKPSGGLGIPKSAEHRAKLSKDYILTSPEGLEYQVHNLRQFCIDHNLNDGHLVYVAQGKRNHHKGWKARYPETA